MNKLIGLKAIVLVMLVSLLDCSLLRYEGRPAAEPKEYDCLLYTTVYVLEDGRTVTTLYEGDKVVDAYIGIVGVTDEVNEREYIIVPRTIDGIRVEKISFFLGERSADWSHWRNKSVKKIYFQATFTNTKVIYMGGLNLDFYSADVFSMDKNGLTFPHGTKNQRRYIPAYFFYDDYKYEYSVSKDNGTLDKFLEKYENYYKGTNILLFRLGYYQYYANTSFIYNYTDAPNNGYYFIDNYDYNSLITFIPPSPTREGYEFLGWYKESECINEWDFETDTIGDPTGLDIDVFETKLYAKWEKVSE